jgi:hypothetical protein
MTAPPLLSPALNALPLRADMPCARWFADDLLMDR